MSLYYYERLQNCLRVTLIYTQLDEYGFLFENLCWFSVRKLNIMSFGKTIDCDLLVRELIGISSRGRRICFRNILVIKTPILYFVSLFYLHIQ